MHSSRRRIAAVLGALAVTGLALLGAPPATAAPMAPSIAWADARIDAVFGGSVESSLRVPGLGDLCDELFACRIDLSARGGSFAAPPAQTLFTDPAGDGTAFWSLEGGTAALPAGTHRLDAALTLPDGAVLRTDEPLTLEVAQNSLEAAVRLDADPGDRSGAVIEASLGGEYLQYVNSYHVAQPLRMPAGTWSVAVTDGDGAEVFAEQRTVPAGGDAAASWYWAEVPADGAFTASASFALAGEAEGNVSVRQPATASYESAEAVAAPIVEITPTAQPEPTVGDSVPIPTGAVAVAGLLAFALLVTAIVLAVRLERRVARADAGGPRTEAVTGG